MKGIRVLAGCEVDILADGRMDFEDDILKAVGRGRSVPPRSAQTGTSKKATDRMLRAIDKPLRPHHRASTGRYIGQRDGLPLDFGKVFAAAAKAGVAMEINASWPRLDLSDTNAKAAVAAGCKLTVDTDAHSTQGLGVMEWGIGVAKRAWVTANNVINCGTFAELEHFLKARR